MGILGSTTTPESGSERARADHTSVIVVGVMRLRHDTTSVSSRGIDSGNSVGTSGWEA